MNEIDRLAAILNSMSPGERLTLSGHQIMMLPSGGSIIEPMSGWDRVKEKVIGSAHPDIWEFQRDGYSGNVTACRLKE